MDKEFETPWDRIKKWKQKIIDSWGRLSEEQRRDMATLSLSKLKPLIDAVSKTPDAAKIPENQLDYMAMHFYIKPEDWKSEWDIK